MLALRVATELDRKTGGRPQRQEMGGVALKSSLSDSQRVGVASLTLKLLQDEAQRRKVCGILVKRGTVVSEGIVAPAPIRVPHGSDLVPP